MALSLGDISIGAEGIYLGNILIGADNLVPLSPIPFVPLQVEFLSVGGGGGGGFRGVEAGDQYRGGGGGAGGVATGSATLDIGDFLEVTVAGGGAGSGIYYGDTGNGGNSQVSDVYTFAKFGQGGGGGGTGNNSSPSGAAVGKDGGSGGGGATLRDSDGVVTFNQVGGATTQVSAFGYGLGQAGCNGGTNNGGSGGTSSTTANTSCPNQNVNGFVWLDGITYAIGGASNTTSAQTAGYGNGGNCNNNGSDGVVVIRYPGTTQRADGGTVTTAGGYTYHTFANGGFFYFNNIR